MGDFTPPFEAALAELRKRIAADTELSEQVKVAALEDLTSAKPNEFAKLKVAAKPTNDKDKDSQGA